MNKSEFDALENRTRIRAEQMWQDAGSPEGELKLFMDDARALVSMSEVPVPTLDPRELIVEEASLQRNLGEFPTLRDQGDEETYPDDEDERNDIHLSDGDASEQGGVLPEADLPENHELNVSTADANITSDWPEGSDDLAGIEEQELDDINDDGLPDQPPVRGAGR